MAHSQTIVPLETPPPDRKSDRPRWLVIGLPAVVLVIGVVMIVISLLNVGRPVTSDESAGEASVQTIAISDASAVIAAETTDLTTSAVVTSEPATEMTDVSDIVSNVIDSVVIVRVTFDVRGPVDAEGSGSGVIINEGGTIVTNAHVVNGASSVTVELTDGTSYEASVLTLDTSIDIAVIEIDATGLTAVEVGTTDGLLVGDPVIAIGNPLGLEGGPSVSTGIVSALDRILEDSATVLTGIIQTDAAITQGSSGGALLNENGELIGITTAVGVSSIGVEGIAFAVPVETVSPVLTALG